MEDDETEETFQPLPFQEGREDSPRLIILGFRIPTRGTHFSSVFEHLKKNIILGFLQGKFTHGYTKRDYWVTDVDANDYGVRAVTIAPSPSGAISQGRAVRRTVEEFISAFLSQEPTPTRSPATPITRTQTPAAGGGAAAPRLALTVASLDVSQRPIAKALRLWPHWQRTAPSLATSTMAAIDDLAVLLGPLMGRAVRGRAAVISALAKVDGQLSFEPRRKSSLRTAVRELGDEALTVDDVGALFRDHLCPGATPGGTPARGPPADRRRARPGPRTFMRRPCALCGGIAAGRRAGATGKIDEQHLHTRPNG
ncbi:hypothetical protein AB1Y20_001213 [Prymnesium parvum]|uniref:Uncharacterized protein n=1 Tax=Prymnesium parvum TaxID=97485 RepID=A0AB34KAL7_PRYPA